jgi:hypothetical protein
LALDAKFKEQPSENVVRQIRRCDVSLACFNPYQIAGLGNIDFEFVFFEKLRVA